MNYLKYVNSMVLTVRGTDKETYTWSREEGTVGMYLNTSRPSYLDTTGHFLVKDITDTSLVLQDAVGNIIDIKKALLDLINSAFQTNVITEYDITVHEYGITTTIIETVDGMNAQNGEGNYFECIGDRDLYLGDYSLRLYINDTRIDFETLKHIFSESEVIS